jgi:hypothetical protein
MVDYDKEPADEYLKMNTGSRDIKPAVFSTSGHRASASTRRILQEVLRLISVSLKIRNQTA